MSFLDLFLKQYEWEREDGIMPPLSENSDNTLILHNTRSDDAGRYICNSYAEDDTLTQNYVDLVIKREYRRKRQQKKRQRTVYNTIN